MRGSIAGISLAACWGLSSCANLPNAPQRDDGITHFYDFRVEDATRKPIAGIEIKASVMGTRPERESETCVTSDSGTCIMQVTVHRDLTNPGRSIFKSQVNYTTSYPGSYVASGTVSNEFGTTYSPDRSNRKSALVKLLKPEDFMSARFMANANRAILDRAAEFVRILVLQGALVDTEVALGGIDESTYKGKSYFRLKLNSTNEFNSVQLDKYQIGKRLFDDSVRKILGPINQILGGTDYFGYDIVVTGHHRNFVKEYSTPEPIEYRFLMSRSVVRQYKDQDISGQQLLDGSVLLMDDERIELKLQ